MKNIFLVLVIALFINHFAKAQAEITVIDYQKKQQPVASFELPYSVNVVEDAIKDKMKRAGYKPNESKGFITFTGVKDSVSGKEIDMVYKVERKSRKEKDISIVYLFAQGTNADMTKTGIGADIESMKTNLNNFRSHVEAYSLEQQINDQESEVKKAEKKMESLQDEQKKLEKKKKSLEDDIANNQKSQESQKSEITNQQKILEVLKSHRKN